MLWCQQRCLLPRWLLYEGRTARDYLTNPRVSLSLNLIFPSAIVLPVTHHGNPDVMTPEAGSHYAQPDDIFCVGPRSDKWLLFLWLAWHIFVVFTWFYQKECHGGRFYHTNKGKLQMTYTVYREKKLFWHESYLSPRALNHICGIWGVETDSDTGSPYYGMLTVCIMCWHWSNWLIHPVHKLQSQRTAGCQSNFSSLTVENCHISHMICFWCPWSFSVLILNIK